MASTTFKNDCRSVPLADFAADISRRCAAYERRVGKPVEIPRNSGKNRTPSKRALLEAIEEAGGRW
ncbi:MAG TPA: hypothetical protein VFP12_05630 [Allosphingosinicella sp.]|nr:hypothetical protein [Allosphingosinicella sp.]